MRNMQWLTMSTVYIYKRYASPFYGAQCGETDADILVLFPSHHN